MSAANNKSKKQDITKAPAKVLTTVTAQAAPANAGGLDDFQPTVSRKQKKGGASEEVKKEEVPAPVQQAPTTTAAAPQQPATKVVAQPPQYQKKEPEQAPVAEVKPVHVPEPTPVIEEVKVAAGADTKPKKKKKKPAAAAPEQTTASPQYVPKQAEPKPEPIAKPIAAPVEDGWSETKKRDKKQAPKERLPSEDTELRYRPKTPVREPEVVVAPAQPKIEAKIEAKAAPHKKEQPAPQKQEFRVKQQKQEPVAEEKKEEVLNATTSAEETKTVQKREPRKKKQEEGAAKADATDSKAAPAKAEKSRGRELVYKPKTAPSAETTAAVETKQPAEGTQVEEKKERLRSKSKPKREQPQLVYKRKDEITPEEKAAAVKISDSAKAEDGAAENKGERRRRDGGSRKDGKDIPRYKSRARGAPEGEEDEQEEPKFTSAYDEYRAGFWRRPKKLKIKVTHETELPAPPKPILEHPDEAGYHKSMADLDEKIDLLIKKSKDLGERFNERISQLKSQSSKKKRDEGEEEDPNQVIPPTASKELRTLFDQMKENTTIRRKIMEQIDAFNKIIGDSENKKIKAEKKVHKTYNKLDLLEKGVKELERKLQVTSTDAAQERAIIKDMAFIKESKPYLEELEVLRDTIFENKKAKYEVGKGLKELKEEAAALQKRIAELKKGQEQAQETREQIQKQLDKINADRNAIREQIGEVRGQKDKCREEYYKKLLAYERQQIVIRDIEFFTGLKTKALEREENRIKWEEEKAKREEERKKKIEEAEKREEARRKREEDRLKEEDERQRKWEESQLQRLDVHPYLYEIDLCDFLYKYCQKQDAILNGRLYENKGASDFVSRSQALKAALEQQRREEEEKRKKAIEERLSKGQLMRADVVNEKKASVAAAKPTEVPQPKKQGAAASTVEEEEDQSLNLDYGIIQKFGRLNITAPIFKEDLAKVLKDLEELKHAFLQKGDEEKEQAKSRFLRESRRARGIPDEPEAKEEEKGEEAPALKTGANADKLKIVEQIARQKRAQTGRGGPRRARRGEDDDGLDFGEDGIDIDTYESSYVPSSYTPGDEDDEGNGAASGGPLGGRDDYDRRGRRGGGQQRGGRGGQRGGRGGYGDERRSKSRGANQQRGGGYYQGGDNRRPPARRNYDDQQAQEEQHDVTQKEAKPQVNKKQFAQVFNKEEEFPTML